MHLNWHILAVGGVVVGTKVIGYQMDLVSVGAVLVGMVGIDVIDHGCWAIVTVRPLTPKIMFARLSQLYNEAEGQLYFFHTVEVFLLVGWLTKYWPAGRWLMMAYGLHLLMDGVKYMSVKKDWNWSKKWFLGWWVKKWVLGSKMDK